MHITPITRNFLATMVACGFQVHAGEDTIACDIIPPLAYGESPLVSLDRSGELSLLFWYNYPVEPLLHPGVQPRQRTVSIWQFKAILRSLTAYAQKHGLQQADSARLLAYHIYGDRRSEIQTDFPAYTPDQIIKLTLMPHIEVRTMQLFLAEHLPFDAIESYDPAIASEFYTALYTPGYPQLSDI